MGKSIRTPGRHYRGNFWAIVMGHKAKDTRPLLLAGWVRTHDKRAILERFRAEYPGRFIRAIPQPYDGVIEVGA